MAQRERERAVVRILNSDDGSISSATRYATAAAARDKTQCEKRLITT